MVYKVDTSGVESGKAQDALNGLQDVIERRVNAFGVAEPLIETSKSGGEQRLIVELAGVKDIEAAKSMIKETPFLEFKKMEAPAEQPPQELSAEDQAYNEQTYSNKSRTAPIFQSWRNKIRKIRVQKTRAVTWIG